MPFMHASVQNNEQISSDSIFAARGRMDCAGCDGLEHRHSSMIELDWVSEFVRLEAKWTRVQLCGGSINPVQHELQTWHKITNLIIIDNLILLRIVRQINRA